MQKGSKTRSSQSIVKNGFDGYKFNADNLLVAKLISISGAKGHELAPLFQHRNRLITKRIGTFSVDKPGLTSLLQSSTIHHKSATFILSFIGDSQTLRDHRHGSEQNVLQSWSKAVGTMLTEYEITSYCFTSRLSLLIVGSYAGPFPQNQCWCELVAIMYCVQLISQH